MNKKSISRSIIYAGVISRVLTSSVIAADYNNDGIDELVIGDPQARSNGVEAMGHVAIVFKQPNGSFEADIWTRERIDGLNNHHPNDSFGYASSSGDFNGDGYMDIAIGALKESQNIGQEDKSGSVYIIYGTSSGFSNVDYTKLTGKSISPFNAFGVEMTTGDYNGDGYDDLAVGSSNRNVYGHTNSDYQQGHGAVDVYFGSSIGLTFDNMLELNQYGSAGVAGVPQVDSDFGSALASGDLNGDGKDDLLIGAPRENITRDDGTMQKSAGSVTVVFGNASKGLNKRTSFRILDSSNDNNSGDRFGATLVTLDYNGDGYDDFVISHPGETVGSKKSAGAVTIFEGHRRIETLGYASGKMVYQSKSGIPGTSESDDYFGSSLAAGDFNNDGADDLVIGAPLEDMESIRNNGLIHVQYGSAGGLSNGEIIHQGTSGVEGTREKYDYFGWSLVAGDFDGDGTDDVMIGVPGEDISGISSGTGMAQRITGGYDGLKPTAGQQQLFHKGTSSIQGMATSRRIGYYLY